MSSLMPVEGSERWPLGIMVVCGFEPHALAPQLETVQQLGGRYVELYCRWSNAPKPAEVGRQVRAQGLEVWSAHGPWGNESWNSGRVDLGTPDPALRDASLGEIRRAIDWLADAGGSRLVVHPGGLSEATDFDARRDALLSSLSQLARDAERQGIVLCVENMPPGCFPGSQMADLAELVAKLSASHVGLCLDTGHANLAADVASAARATAGLLRTTHVHDNGGHRDEHLPPGLGTVPWPVFTRVMAEIDYRGAIMIECPRYLREHPEVINDELCRRLRAICGAASLSEGRPE